MVTSDHIIRLGSSACGARAYWVKNLTMGRSCEQYEHWEMGEDKAEPLEKFRAMSYCGAASEESLNNFARI